MAAAGAGDGSSIDDDMDAGAAEDLARWNDISTGRSRSTADGSGVTADAVAGPVAGVEAEMGVAAAMRSFPMAASAGEDDSGISRSQAT